MQNIIMRASAGKDMIMDKSKLIDLSLLTAYDKLIAAQMEELKQNSGGKCDLNSVINLGTGKKSLIIGEGSAPGAYSIVGGSTDKSVISGIVGSAISNLITPIAPQAIGNGSFAFFANTQSLSDGSIAIGPLNQCGVKGLYYRNIDKTKNEITLSKSRSSQSGNNLAATYGWQVGDTISFVNGTPYAAYTTITKIVGNVITVEKLPETIISYEASKDLIGAYLPDDFSICAFYRKEVATVKIPFTDTILAENYRWYPREGAVNLEWPIVLGQMAISMGVENLSSGAISYATGYNNWAAGDFSFVAGRENIVGYAAFSSGKGNTATGLYALASGLTNIITGMGGRAGGRENEVHGAWGGADGQWNKVFGNAGFAAGQYNEVYGAAAASFGWRTKAYGQGAFSAGMFTITNADGQAAFGKYNLIDDTALFIIGAGSSENDRKNALSVAQDGTIKAHQVLVAEKDFIAKKASFGEFCEEDQDAIVVFGDGDNNDDRGNVCSITKNGFKLSEAQFGTKDIQAGDYLPHGIFYFMYDKNIDFTLDAKEYRVDDEMTWSQWIQATGKNDGFGLTSKGVVTYTNSDTNSTKCVEDHFGNVAFGNDVIYVNTTYTSGHINPEAYGQEEFDVVLEDSYISGVTFEKIGSHEFDLRYLKQISDDSVKVELANRDIAGSAYYGTDYYKVEPASGDINTVSKLTYYFAQNSDKLFLCIKDDSSEPWVDYYDDYGDAIYNNIIRNNYYIRLGLDKLDYSKCLVAPIKANQGAATANTEVFTSKFYDSRKTSAYHTDTGNVITNMAIMKRYILDPSTGQMSSGTASNTSERDLPYIAYIKYEIDKQALISAWNSAFGTSLTSIPEELYLAVSCANYHANGDTLKPYYGGIMSKPQMDTLDATITTGVKKSCPILPHVIKIPNDESKVMFSLKVNNDWLKEEHGCESIVYVGTKIKSWRYLIEDGEIPGLGLEQRTPDSGDMIVVYYDIPISTDQNNKVDADSLFVDGAVYIV